MITFLHRIGADENSFALNYEIVSSELFNAKYFETKHELMKKNWI